MHKGKWEIFLLSVLHFRSGIWEVSEDLTEAGRRGREPGSIEAAFRKLVREREKYASPPSPSKQIPNLYTSNISTNGKVYNRRTYMVCLYVLTITIFLSRKMGTLVLVGKC